MSRSDVAWEGLHFLVKIRLIQVQENMEGRFCVILVVCGSGKVPTAAAVTGDGGMRGCRDGGMLWEPAPRDSWKQE